jgi:hypothetical protein
MHINYAIAYRCLAPSCAKAMITHMGFHATPSSAAPISRAARFVNPRRTLSLVRGSRAAGSRPGPGRARASDANRSGRDLRGRPGERARCRACRPAGHAGPGTSGHAGPGSSGPEGRGPSRPEGPGLIRPHWVRSARQRRTRPGRRLPLGGPERRPGCLLGWRGRGCAHSLAGVDGAVRRSRNGWGSCASGPPGTAGRAPETVNGHPPRRVPHRRVLAAHRARPGRVLASYRASRAG